MADTKIMSNGQVTVWWVPPAGIADFRSPTAAEVNAGINLSPAIAWDGFELGATESNDLDDRSLVDAGNAVTRGFEQFSAALPMFRSLDPNDVTSDYVKAFETFRVGRVNGYLIERVIAPAAGPMAPAAEGDVVSVYRFMSDYVSDDTEGEDSYKFEVGFLPQGDLIVNTQIKNTTPVTVTPATLPVTVGDVETVTATLGTRNYTQGVTWATSDPTVAQVTPNGVVIGRSAGTASITATHPAATGPGTVAVTVS